MDDAAPKIILGVPGMWKDRTEIVQSVAGKSDGFLMLGPLIQDTAANEHFPIEIDDHDPALGRAFSIAGRRTMTPEDISAIERHTFTLYVVGDGGSQERARTMMRVASGLLKAGGLGVKVESAGVAHNANNWNALLASPEPAALYHAFVTLAGADDAYYSCGMHNLGLPDVNAPRSLTPEEAAELMEGFLGYLLYESPDLASGHTFSLDASGPLFTLHLGPCSMFPEGDSFHNPYGVWNLV